MLLDSNIVIYASKPSYDNIRTFLRDGYFSVSVITKIEVLGYHGLPSQERQWLEAAFAALPCLPLDGPVIDLTIEIRQRQTMYLADAVIAATAIHHSLPLVTRNTSDFESVSGLQLIDPFKS